MKIDPRMQRARLAVRRALQRSLRAKPEAMPPAIISDAQGRVTGRIDVDPMTGERTRVEKKRARG